MEKKGNLAAVIITFVVIFLIGIISGFLITAGIHKQAVPHEIWHFVPTKVIYHYIWGA